jgi:hypothetical protein
MTIDDERRTDVGPLNISWLLFLDLKSRLFHVNIFAPFDKVQAGPGATSGKSPSMSTMPATLKL